MELTLGGVYKTFRNQWRAGDRDRELGLHLMFIAGRELSLTFAEVHDHLAPSIDSDAEMLYAVGLMARLCPWCIGDVALWERRSERYRRAYRELAPDGIPPSTFEGRGFYGKYFEHQSRVPHGY